MCGIFAFTGVNPDPVLLAAAVDGASRRGPHGHGWAVCTPKATVVTRHLGPLAARTSEIIAACAGLDGIVLGHARMATVGAWDNKDNLQPVLAGDITVAHNGVITNPDVLYPHAPTDSIALTRAYRILRNNNFTPVQALQKLLASADQQAWAIVIADAGALWIHRRRHPLWTTTDKSGVYLSSHRFHPQAEPIPEDQICRLWDRHL